MTVESHDLHIEITVAVVQQVKVCLIANRADDNEPVVQRPDDDCLRAGFTCDNTEREQPHTAGKQHEPTPRVDAHRWFLSPLVPVGLARIPSILDDASAGRLKALAAYLVSH